MTNIRLVRTDSLEPGMDATYRQDGDDVLVLIDSSLITERGCQVLADLAETAVDCYWGPKVAQAG